MYGNRGLLFLKREIEISSESFCCVAVLLSSDHLLLHHSVKRRRAGLPLACHSSPLYKAPADPDLLCRGNWSAVSVFVRYCLLFGRRKPSGVVLSVCILQRIALRMRVHCCTIKYCANMLLRSKKAYCSQIFRASNAPEVDTPEPDANGRSGTGSRFSPL